MGNKYDVNKISALQCFTNSANIGPNEDLLAKAKKRTLRWYGHVHDPLALQGTREGKRRREDNKRTKRTTLKNLQINPKASGYSHAWDRRWRRMANLMPKSPKERRAGGRTGTECRSAVLCDRKVNINVKGEMCRAVVNWRSQKIE